MFLHGKCDDDIPAFCCSKHRDSYFRWLRQHPEQRIRSISRPNPGGNLVKKEYVPIAMTQPRLTSEELKSRKGRRFPSRWSKQRILDMFHNLVYEELFFKPGYVREINPRLYVAITSQGSSLCLEVSSLRGSTAYERFIWVAEQMGFRPLHAAQGEALLSTSSLHRCNPRITRYTVFVRVRSV